eukprot:6177337-Pleurochrysis_carterae.AAC.1
MPRARLSFFGALRIRTRTRGRHTPSSPCCFAKGVLARSTARIDKKFSSLASSAIFGVKTSALI